MTRQTRTPEARATEALAVADRLVKRLQAKHDALMAEAVALEPEIDQAKRRRDYLALSPDLPQTDGDVVEATGVES